MERRRFVVIPRVLFVHEWSTKKYVDLIKRVCSAYQITSIDLIVRLDSYCFGVLEAS
jgi:hypothetical protein